MSTIPTQLGRRGQPVRTGVIGAGLFGTNLVTQLERADGLRASAIADLETEKAIRTLTGTGVPAEEIAVVDDATEADEVIATGQRAVLADGTALAEADLEVVVEATGVPDAAARHAYTALADQTHVVMATVEAGTVVGPLLAELAANNGVTYSMAYGDQPALIAELYDWARTAGLDVVAAGKGNPFLEEYRYGTPDDIFDRIGFDDEFVDAYDLNPYMYNSFFDGTKVAVEMCAVANATGLSPDVPGMHLPTAEIPDIPEKLRPEADGGLLGGTGVVDTVSTRYPDGTDVQRDSSFGVFIVTTTPTDRIRDYFAQYSGAGLHTANDGKYQLFYRPYHLPGIETGISVANAALRNEPTGVPRNHEAEVVGAAKRSLTAGDELDGGGGYAIYGVLVGADTAVENRYVPFELLDGATVAREVDRDGILTHDDVELREDTFIYELRQLQDETVGGKPRD